MTPEAQNRQRGNEEHYPEGLRKKEAGLIAARRQKVDPARFDEGGGRETATELPDDCLGLALSGGGIRSATFCLGFLQVLAGRGLLRRVDFLSTVSGGGYAGSFVGRWFSRPDRPSSETEQGGHTSLEPTNPGTGSLTSELATSDYWRVSESSIQHVHQVVLRESVRLPSDRPRVDSKVEKLERELNSPDSSPIRWLRENGRYMSPTGPGDVFNIVAIYLRNLVAVHLLLAVSLLSVFLAGAAVRATTGRLIDSLGWRAAIEAVSPSGGTTLWWSPWLLLPAVLFAVVAVPLGWAYWLIPQSRAEHGRRNTALWTAVVVLLVALGVGGWIEWRGARDPFELGVGVAAIALAVLAVLTLGIWCFSWCGSRSREKVEKSPEEGRPPSSGTDKRENSASRARNRLSRWLTSALGWTGAVLVFALVDTIGQSFYAVASCQGWSETLINMKVLPPVAGALAVVAAVRKLMPLFERSPKSARFKVPLNWLLGAGAVLVVAVLLIAVAVAAHTLSWSGQAPVGDPGRKLIAYAGEPTEDLGGDRDAESPIGKPHLWHPASGTLPFSVPWVALAAAGFVALCMGRTFQFLNLSSHHALYAARLTRAYLGATNAERKRSVREFHEDDDIRFEDYKPHEAGGPLHLINVTINETVGGSSQIQYRDRKGLPMALGPAGVSVGSDDHAVWEWGEEGGEPARPPGTQRSGGAPRLRPIAGADGEPRRCHPFRLVDGRAPNVEPRSLGQWMAISGAAFTTGLGFRTSLGSSLLLGLSNIRLGYWWDGRIGEWGPCEEGTEKRTSSVLRRLNPVLPVHTYLFSEILGRFRGTTLRHWYLSDGGHFENSGCYELIRRRVPRIICCDCGADPEYQWQDLANLARKVRIDFNAELRFFQAGDPTPDWLPPAMRRRVGPRSGIGKRPEPATPSEPRRFHCTVARVYYKDVPEQRQAYYRRGEPSGSTIVFVKPSLTGDERIDVREYATRHETFPQESTLDQNFDEAQWESYRKLGEHIGGALLADFEDDPWWGST